MAIADLAGGEWPERARAACKALAGDDDDAEASLGVRLLTDLKAIYGSDVIALHTETIIERLCAFPEAPWSDYFGRRVTPRDIAKLLKPYGVSSKTVRESGAAADAPTRKGYHADDLRDAWSRYVQPTGDERHKGNTGNSAAHDAEHVTDVTDDPSQGEHAQRFDQERDRRDGRDGTPPLIDPLANGYVPCAACSRSLPYGAEPGDICAPCYRGGVVP